METYKGTDKDMKCYDGYQYTLGEKNTDDGAIRCGDKGFHSCEAPMDVLRYFPMRDGNRYFTAEAGGEIDRSGADDSKIASSELTLKAEIGLPGIIKAHMEYTRKKAEAGTSGGDYSNLAGGDNSNLAGGDDSNLVGGNYSNLSGGDNSNLAGGNYSNLASGHGSNLAGGSYSNLAGGDGSNLIGGYRSNLASGYGSNLIGGYHSNLASGERSVVVGRNGSKAKAGVNSVIVLTEWGFSGDEYVPTAVKAVIVDGKTVKADTWYTLVNGELTETEE